MGIYQPWYCDVISQPTFMALERIEYGGNGMQILLREVAGEKRLICLRFIDLPMAVRISNESQRLESLRELPKGTRNSLYVVSQSTFLSWLHEESLQIYKDDPLFHLAIVMDEWIDIICNELPSVVIAK
ncbi:hypothetical protein GCM10027277_01500 [Pseudoduganella ginsengisoli]|uniref:Uncharacterized protein n=1 Tax=Pseudoduganella ginsengisoli TaxID=1462440 RepID=A0A6L6Q8W5_9BURK|nr:hypothetical protein [Pseudoduganella ginsengisoli]MTW06100.1 hypothetical protein [Pseudoduganella ginsengisoli]